MSDERVVTASSTSPASSPGRLRIESRTFVKARCGISTPFGLPVIRTCEWHVGEIRSRCGRRGISLAGCTPSFFVCVQLNHGCGALREAVRQRRVSDDRPGRGIFEDQVDASLRKMGVERKVGRAAFQMASSATSISTERSTQTATRSPRRIPD